MEITNERAMEIVNRMSETFKENCNRQPNEEDWKFFDRNGVLPDEEEIKFYDRYKIWLR